jgi:IS5 family transposase
VECIGKGKTRSTCEFRCKASVATPVTEPKGGQIMLHARALYGKSYHGHTLTTTVADVAAMTRAEVQRTAVGKSCRDHSHPNRFQVWISGQVRMTTAAVKREMERRAAIELVIRRPKVEQRMARNHLKGREGDHINAIVAAFRYNFSL